MPSSFTRLAFNNSSQGANERAGVDEQTADANAAAGGANTLRDLGVNRQTAARRKHHAHRGGLTGKREWHGRGLDFASLFEVLLLPQFLEIKRVIIGQSRRVDFNDVIFHQRKRVIRDVK